RAGTGAIRFQSPEELRALLRQMAAQRFIDQKRRAEAGRRNWRLDKEGLAVFGVVDAGAGPEEGAAQRGLYQEVRRCFTSPQRARGGGGGGGGGPLFRESRGGGGGRGGGAEEAKSRPQGPRASFPPRRGKGGGGEGRGARKAPPAARRGG